MIRGQLDVFGNETNQSTIRLNYTLSSKISAVAVYVDADTPLCISILGKQEYAAVIVPAFLLALARHVQDIAEYYSIHYGLVDVLHADSAATAYAYHTLLNSTSLPNYLRFKN